MSKDSVEVQAEKDRIIEFARGKFHSEGFFKTSMDELASELKISKKTIYKHFPSKDNLIEQICAYTSTELTGKVDGIVDSDSDVITKFVLIMNLYNEFTFKISEKWLRDLRLKAPYEASKIDQKRHSKINDVLTKLIRQGKKEKLIVNISEPLIINTFSASISSILNPDFLARNRMSVHSAFKETYDLLLNGMLTNKGKLRLKKVKASYENKIEIKKAI